MSDVATVNNSAGLLNFIERASRDTEFDVQKFEALLRMQREIIQEQAQREFNQAMAAAQAEMLPVIRDATNTHTGNKYARLETIDREMRPIYTRHGFSVRFGSAVSPRDGHMRIVCTVSHTGGYSETNYLDAPPDRTGTGGKSSKTDVQAVGSSVTYLRRYLTTMVFNIVLADDDTDGEASRRPATGSPEQWQDWLRRLRTAMDAATSSAELTALHNRETVQNALALDEREGGAPLRIKRDIRAMFTEAYKKLAPAADADATREETWDPIAELLAEVDAMDAIALQELSTNAEWRSRVNAATKDFPPDADRILEHIEMRKQSLRPRREA